MSRKVFENEIEVEASNAYLAEIEKHITDSLESFKKEKIKITDESIISFLYAQTPADIVSNHIVPEKFKKNLIDLSTRSSIEKLEFNSAWAAAFFGLTFIFKNYAYFNRVSDGKGKKKKESSDNEGADLFDSKWKRLIKEEIKSQTKAQLDSGKTEDEVDVQIAIPSTPFIEELPMKFKKPVKGKKDKNIKLKEEVKYINDKIIDLNLVSEIKNVNNLAIMLITKGIKHYYNLTVDPENISYKKCALIIHELEEGKEPNEDDDDVDTASQIAEDLCELPSYGYLLIKALNYEMVSLKVFREKAEKCISLVGVVVEFSQTEDRKILPYLYPMYIIEKKPEDEEEKEDSEENEYSDSD